jgi:hypothetical protein
MPNSLLTIEMITADAIFAMCTEVENGKLVTSLENFPKAIHKLGEMLSSHASPEQTRKILAHATGEFLRRTDVHIQSKMHK